MTEMEELKKYLKHLPTCSTQQNWSEAEQAMSDTPERFRDEGWHLAYEEMRQKKNTCTCGLEKILSGEFQPSVKPEEVLRRKWDELYPGRQSLYGSELRELSIAAMKEFAAIESERSKKYPEAFVLWFRGSDFYDKFEEIILENDMIVWEYMPTGQCLHALDELLKYWKENE